MTWPTANPTQTYVSAPFLRRLGARVFDLLFNLALTFVVAIPVAILTIPVAPFLDEDQERLLAPLLGALCYLLAYVCLEVFLLVRREGQTLGKGLLGLRVVSTRTDSPRITLTAAVTRMTIIFLPFVLMSVAGTYPENGLLNALAFIGFFSLVASLILTLIPAVNRRSIHDFVAGTRVVRAPKRAINLKKDLQMAVPGKIDLTKRL